MEQFCAASVPRPPPTDGAAATGLHEPQDSSGKPSAPRLARPPFIIACASSPVRHQAHLQAFCSSKPEMKRSSGCEHEAAVQANSSSCPPSFRQARVIDLQTPQTPRLPPRRRRADCASLQDPSPCTSTVRAANATIETSVPRHPFPGPC